MSKLTTNQLLKRHDDIGRAMFAAQRESAEYQRLRAIVNVLLKAISDRAKTCGNCWDARRTNCEPHHPRSGFLFHDYGNDFGWGCQCPPIKPTETRRIAYDRMEHLVTYVPAWAETPPRGWKAPDYIDVPSGRTADWRHHERPPRDQPPQRLPSSRPVLPWYKSGCKAARRSWARTMRERRQRDEREVRHQNATSSACDPSVLLTFDNLDDLQRRPLHRPQRTNFVYCGLCEFDINCGTNLAYTESEIRTMWAMRRLELRAMGMGGIDCLQ
jgi:hypothetical protein